jgi:hypothetical protein
MALGTPVGHSIATSPRHIPMRFFTRRIADSAIGSRRRFIDHPDRFLLLERNPRRAGHRAPCRRRLSRRLVSKGHEGLNRQAGAANNDGRFHETAEAGSEHNIDTETAGEDRYPASIPPP